MKKAIWGYNIHEVDESIDYLETQNIKLEKQVRQLLEDLEKVRVELRLYEESANGEDGADGENEKITAELRSELDSLKIAYERSEKEREKSERELERSEKERKSLSAEVSRLNSKLAEEGTVFSDVGNICRLAYEDMHNAKLRAKENVENFLKIFWGEWEEYQRRVCDLSAEIKRRQQESRNFFIESADKILHVYGSMNQNNREFENGLSEIIDVKDSLQAKLEEFLARLEEDVRDDDVGIQDAEGACQESSQESSRESIRERGYERRKENEEHSIFRSIEAMRGNGIHESGVHINGIYDDIHENGVYGNNMHERDMQENGVHGNNMHERNIQENDVYGNNMHGRDMQENDVYGNNMHEKDMYENGVHENNIRGNSAQKNSIHKNSGFLGQDGGNYLSEAESARKRSVNRGSERFGEQKNETVWKSVRAAAKEAETSGGRFENETAVKKEAAAESRLVTAAKEELSSEGRSEKLSRNYDNDYISENVSESAENRAGVCGDDTKKDGHSGAEPNQAADGKESFSISSEVNVRNII